MTDDEMIDPSLLDEDIDEEELDDMDEAGEDVGNDEDEEESY